MSGKQQRQERLAADRERRQQMRKPSDLIAFLTARLDEDQHRAEVMRGLVVPEASYYRGDGSARPFREVAAKRAILDAYTANDADVGLHLGPYPRKHGQWDGLRLAVWHLASVYSDHPDYREEWKP